MSGSLCKQFFFGVGLIMSNRVCAIDKFRSGIVKRAVGVLVRDLRRPGPWRAYYGGVPRGSTTVRVAEIFLLRLYVVITSFGWRSSE